MDTVELFFVSFNQFLNPVFLYRGEGRLSPKKRKNYKEIKQKVATPIALASKACTTKVGGTSYTYLVEARSHPKFAKVSAHIFASRYTFLTLTSPQLCFKAQILRTN